MERTKWPGIYKRGGRYVVVWKHRGRQYKSFHRTLAEAREQKGQRDGGERKPTSRETFEDYARAWLGTYNGRTSHGLAESTRAGYKQAVEQHAIPFFRRSKLADVEPPDVRRFAVQLASKGLAPSSVLKVLAPVKALFATAVEDGTLRSNPTAGIRIGARRAEEDGEVEAKAMTRAELGRLLAVLPEEWRLFFELLAHSGLRISETLGLDWPDVQFGKRPRLRVRRQFYRGSFSRLKTRNARRDLPLSPGVARRVWAARPPNGEGPMFATRNSTRYIDRNVRRVLDAAGKDAGTPWVTFHTFRHTCASMLFENGKNIRQVCDWLGHADPAFTLRVYVHQMDGGLGEADFLDTAVRVGNPWATQDPKTAANAQPTPLPNSALESGNEEQPQTAATAQASS
jgi:integrase